MPAPLVALVLLAAQDHAVMASPFDGLRWSGGAPEVRVEDAWYRPVAIDGIAVERVLAFCDERWPGQREKRFAEDLVEALVLLGWEGDLVVDLDLVRVPDGAEVRLAGVPMTHEKRQQLRAEASRERRSAPRRPASVPRAAALADVDAFARGLRERFAYLHLRGIDLDAELAAVRESLADPADVAALAEALHAVLMRFGDGHARVEAPEELRPPEGPFLPFLLVESAAGVVAVRPDRGALVDERRPVVVAIDGRPLEDWLAAVRPRVPAGSPQLVRARSLRELRDVERARRALGLPTGVPVRVELADEKGRRREELELALVAEKPLYGEWPRTTTRELRGRVGYLRLARMDDAVDELRRSMAELRGTRGLVIDVRGNGGGSRDLLVALAGYLIGPDDPALVANVAAYRLAEGFGSDHLAARFLFRADWEGWGERQRAAIAALDFEPEWRPPEGELSAWHYLVLDRTGHAEEYHYDAPVFVLCDADAFSATDVLLGALELLPRVTLVGTASGGGSARAQPFRLPATGIEVVCASMASFRPDGRLYDGRGVEVDVEVLPDPEDATTSGRDAQLERALEVLRRGGRSR